MTLMPELVVSPIGVFAFAAGTVGPRPATWTQLFSNWEVTPTAWESGEVLVNAGTQILQDGNESGNTANAYGYSYAIPDGKTVQSVQLPNNKAVGILGISLL
jgi:hypothetical protein